MAHIDSYFSNKHLKASDMAGEVRTLTIRTIQPEEVGEDKEARPVLYFSEVDKGLVLNKTNGRRIQALYGPEVEGWTGKPIMLYPTTCEFRGEEVECLRVKQQPPPVAPGPSEAAPTSAPPEATGTRVGEYLVEVQRQKTEAAVDGVLDVAASDESLTDACPVIRASDAKPAGWSSATRNAAGLSKSRGSPATLAASGRPTTRGRFHSTRCEAGAERKVRTLRIWAQTVGRERASVR